MQHAGSPELTAALDRLWTQFLPQIEERVAVLEAAAAALAVGMLTQDASLEAASAAHKLAGVLGTFGLAEGTALAREAEAFYAGVQFPSPAEAQRQIEVTGQLRALVIARKSS
jgi:HPt (histidine-containing phosphotransfer) domain-containing protein